MVEHNLAKVGVASSSLVSRSSVLEAGWHGATVAWFSASWVFQVAFFGWLAGLKSILLASVSADIGKASAGQFVFCHPLRGTVFRDGGCLVVVSGPRAGWQSGYAAACKAVDAGSIPTPASKSSPQVMCFCGVGLLKGCEF